MASENNNFQSTVESLFKGMDSFISTKTVVGDTITVGDTIILPLVDVTFGVGAGAFSGEKKNNGGGGMGGKVSPSAVLVISAELLDWEEDIRKGRGEENLRGLGAEDLSPQRSWF